MDSDQDVSNTKVFLKLPAEIRNQIYRLVLLSHQKLKIGTDDALQPDLTKVCRQIRCETLSIFYGNNEFVFDMYNFNCTGMVIWHRMLDSNYAVGPKDGTVMNLQPILPDQKVVARENLMRWAQEYLDGSPSWRIGTERNGNQNRSGGAFNFHSSADRFQKFWDVAQTLREMQMTWAVAERLVNDMIDGMGILELRYS